MFDASGNIVYPTAARKIDFVITKSISRFSRNTTDCLALVRKLLNLNIPIFFEKENINTGSMESELFLAILSSMAEGESASISENSKWSIKRRFQNGTYKLTCRMKYVRDDDIKAAFVTILNKLIYGHRLILAPYLKALENSSGDEALQRIQHLELLLDQNSEQRETLAKLMAQGYIDQILYNQETNALLLQAKTYRSDIEAITICMTGNSAKVTETNLLLHFVSHADMLTNYSEELFESYADHIEISGRNEIRFVMKCGLTFTERIGD